MNEFGEDAYWLARTCERQSPSEPRRHHWHVVATEIERHTARTSAAMPDTRKTAGSPRAAYGRHFATRNAGLPRHDAYRAGAPAGLDDEHSQSQGCYHRALRIAAAKEYDQHHEDRPRYAGAAPAERNHGGNFERGDTTGLRVEEMHDDSPRKNRRSGIVTMLVLIGWATVGTAGAYVSRTYYFGAQTSAALYQAKPAEPAVRGDPPAATAKAAVGGYVVQVTAQQSKADALASFRSLQAKFPSQLSGRTAIVRRADLGAKGIYYRALVGPFGSAGEADQFCSSLKTAGGRCIILRN